MTLLPSPHVRDPRRRYRANKIRKFRERSVPPLVVVPEALVRELALAPTDIRTRALMRLEQERGAGYVQLVLAALTPYMIERKLS